MRSGSAARSPAGRGKPSVAAADRHRAARRRVCCAARARGGPAGVQAVPFVAPRITLAAGAAVYTEPGPRQPASLTAHITMPNLMREDRSEP